MTTLHHAAALGDEKALRTALTKDTVNQVDSMGATPLIAGTVNAQPAAVALLLDAGADPRATDRTGATALHWCATYDQAEIARALIAAGADPDATCALRQTPLHWCATRGAVAVAKVLLDAGADAELRDQAGLSALSLAKAHRHANVAGLLQKAALW